MKMKIGSQAHVATLWIFHETQLRIHLKFEASRDQTTSQCSIRWRSGNAPVEEIQIVRAAFFIARMNPPGTRARHGPRSAASAKMPSKKEPPNLF